VSIIDKEERTMPYVVCNIDEGLRPSEVTVEVRDIQARPEFLRVPRDFVKQFNGHYYLPIGIVYHDRDNDRFWIELPHEADSGINRLWVSRQDLHDPQKRAEAIAT
jgi:hypothetical protein